MNLNKYTWPNPDDPGALSRLVDERDAAVARAEKAETALRSITKPGGAYSRDKEEYFKNIIEWCIETAEEALATTPEPTEEKVI